MYKTETAKPDFVKMFAKSFDSLSDLHAFLKRNGKARGAGVDDKWAGGSWETALNRCIVGNMDLVAKSDALLDKFEDVSVETPKKGWRNDIVGARPNVQAFLAGNPMSMRRRTQEDSAFSPVTVFVNTAASAMFDPEDVLKRGIAVLAFVRLLSMRRPVELYVGFVSQSYDKKVSTQAIRVDTTPLDLARAAFMLGDVCFMRQLMINLSYHNGGKDSLPQISPQNFHAAIRAAVPTIGSQLVAIPHLDSRTEQAVRNPKAYVLELLKSAELTNIDDEEAA
jgi:hypothetical protein